jgi:hypothetical protein
MGLAIGTSTADDVDPRLLTRIRNQRTPPRCSLRVKDGAGEIEQALSGVRALRGGDDMGWLWILLVVLLLVALLGGFGYARR